MSIARIALTACGAALLALGAPAWAAAPLPPPFTADLFVADAELDQIIRVSPDGLTRTTFATGFPFPTALAFDAMSNLFVADAALDQIVKITPDGLTRITVATGLPSPTALAFDISGNLFVADKELQQIDVFSARGTRRTFVRDIPEPTALAFDAAGNLFVADATLNAILNFPRTGRPAPTVFADGFDNPTALAFDTAGNLFVADFSMFDSKKQGRINKLDPTGVTIDSILGFKEPTALALDASGNLFVADAGLERVDKITPDRERTAFAKGFPTPTAIAFIPEPGTLVLVGSGIVGLLGYTRLRRRKAVPRSVGRVLLFTLIGLAGSSLPADAFVINIVPGPGLSGNPDALAAFDRAAARWAARIADPISVNIDADLVNFGNPGIIGRASSVLLQTDYDVIRDQMVADASAEGDDDIVRALPTAAQATFIVPTGVALDRTVGSPTEVDLAATKAKLKAMGFTDLDAVFGTRDGTIESNTQFSFDSRGKWRRR